MARYALLLAYDGTAFSGWWRQPGRRTVAGTLDAAFAALGDQQAACVGASRTDAGVHARGQVAHVDLIREREPGRLAGTLDHHLPGDCACLGAAVVADGFNAPAMALWKTYTYQLDQGPVRDPLARPAWRPPGRPDPGHLKDLACLLHGQFDLRAFLRASDHRLDPRVTFREVTWEHQSGGRMVCRMTADRYLYHLARTLVGIMVHEAAGLAPRGSLAQALTGEMVAAAGQSAPAHGLTLEQVEYEQPLAWKFGLC